MKLISQISGSINENSEVIIIFTIKSTKDNFVPISEPITAICVNNKFEIKDQDKMSRFLSFINNFKEINQDDLFSNNQINILLDDGFFTEYLNEYNINIHIVHKSYFNEVVETYFSESEIRELLTEAESFDELREKTTETYRRFFYSQLPEFNVLFFRIEALTRSSSTREKYFFNKLSQGFNPDLINSLNELFLYLNFISLIGKDLFPFSFSKKLIDEDLFHFELLRKVIQS